MTKKWDRMFLLVSAELILACASTKGTGCYTKPIQLEKYKTFFIVSMMPVKTKTMERPLFGNEIFTEMKSILERKGLRETSNPASGDLNVHFYFMWKNQSDFRPPPYKVGQWQKVWILRPGQIVRYKEGTIFIDIVDQSNKELIWEGVGRNIFDKKGQSHHLRECIRKILEQFPSKR